MAGARAIGEKGSLEEDSPLDDYLMVTDCSAEHRTMELFFSHLPRMTIFNILSYIYLYLGLIDRGDLSKGSVAYLDDASLREMGVLRTIWQMQKMPSRSTILA